MYDGQEHYAAVFDEIKIKGFFVYGRIGAEYFNLSRDKDNVNKAYKRFNFSLSERLLVVGYTLSGKVDVMDDTGEHFYLTDGDYSKVQAIKKQSHYGNDDVLLVKRKGKQGLYNWSLQKEVLAPVYDKIIIHESCDSNDYFLFAKEDGKNLVIGLNGEVKMSFRSKWVKDIKPSSICEGYYLYTSTGMGYCVQLSNGKYFLIKPVFNRFFFPLGDPSVIVTEKGDKLGLYYNFKRLLKPQFSEIELLMDNYILARVKKGEEEYLLKRTGELIKN
jgi:hypothetical protein